ncbi:C-1-tetrahydrofolate synthase [Purpureocillium lavendulum]|uniref:C-1-tetrahydrofolate synthase n=1 Tax=Purpureocillium lavendulum TaxID=1247861 RepID=A0AB34FXB1_9HYPO|nr:C-1-tetrahydrofolate synthase [Purpureocillium lavendulum]
MVPPSTMLETDGASLARFLPQDDENHVFWWKTAGRHFARMMHEARYPEQRQVELLLFFRFVMAPRLGPKPSTSEPWFRSRVAPGVGDGSPIGYSWRWGTGGSKPLIRHYMEAMGPLTGTSADPLNEFAAKEMLCALGKIMPGVELPLAWKFAAHIRPSLVDEETRKAAGSSMLIGLQCAPDAKDVEVMAGLMTKSPSQVRELLNTIFPRAMRDAYGEDAPLDSLHMVRDFLQTHPQGSHLTMLGTTAIDCCTADTSRFKVYVTTSTTSFDHIAAVMTLGGRKPESSQSLAQLKDLWYGLKGLDAGFPTSSEPPSGLHGGSAVNGNANISGVTFYFDIHPKYPYPHVKLQVDVSKHSPSDISAIRAVMSFLERRCQGQDARAYLNVARGMVSDAELRTKRGFQAFYAFAFKKGEVDITSYFLPQIYRRFAETQGELSAPASPRLQRRSRFDSY